jgi:hypothetical protein
VAFVYTGASQDLKLDLQLGIQREALMRPIDIFLSVNGPNLGQHSSRYAGTFMLTVRNLEGGTMRHLSVNTKEPRGGIQNIMLAPLWYGRSSLSRRGAI